MSDKNSIAAELTQQAATLGAAVSANKGGKRRNYKAMADGKLMEAVEELEHGGEAYDRCVDRGSGNPAGDLQHAREIAR
ncbi:MAG: hypothetical protein WKH68_12185, partial [Candidatus Limnocylindria bacterium]